MPDRFAGKIWIGGTVTREQLKGLVAVLRKDEASDDWGNPPIPNNLVLRKGTIEQIWDRLALYLDDEGLLHLVNDRAENGEFEHTEQFCIDNDIPYDRWSDHFYHLDAENVFWRPGMNVPTITFDDANASEIVDGATVRQAMAKLDTWMHDQRTSLIEEARRLLHDACPDKSDKTPLPKFSLVP